METFLRNDETLCSYVLGLNTASLQHGRCLGRDQQRQQAILRTVRGAQTTWDGHQSDGGIDRAIFFVTIPSCFESYSHAHRYEARLSNPPVQRLPQVVDVVKLFDTPQLSGMLRFE